MVHFAPTKPSRRIRRVRYRSDSQSLTLSFKYPEQKSDPDVSISAVEESATGHWMDQLDVMLSGLDKEDLAAGRSARAAQSGQSITKDDTRKLEELSSMDFTSETATTDDIDREAGNPFAKDDIFADPHRLEKGFSSAIPDSPEQDVQTPTGVLFSAEISSIKEVDIMLPDR